MNKFQYAPGQEIFSSLSISCYRDSRSPLTYLALRPTTSFSPLNIQLPCESGRARRRRAEIVLAGGAGSGEIMVQFLQALWPYGSQRGKFSDNGLWLIY